MASEVLDTARDDESMEPSSGLAAQAGDLVAGSVRDTSRPRALSVWLFIVAGLVFAMVVVGGATRLTQSGLSMVEWEPVSGAIPPLSQSAWEKEFDAYQQTPEFQHVNSEMTLSQFKGIFWWEFVHRFLGRIVGLALAVPFAWFLIRRAVPPGFGPRLLLLVALVGLQGAIGWWMVASGLVDRPDVAHERLALHLVTALILLGALVWTALDLCALDSADFESAPAPERPVRAGAPQTMPFRLAVAFIVTLFIQYVLGAFVAGLDAGRIHNTWPMMNGTWIPYGITELSPVWSNVVDNPVTVQFLHRWFAVIVAGVSVALAYVMYRVGETRLATVLEVVVLAQFTLGVFTLLHAVPVGLGIAHQAVGALVLVVGVFVAHHARKVEMLGRLEAANANPPSRHGV